MDAPKPLTPSPNYKVTEEIIIKQENKNYKILFETQEIESENKLLIKVNLIDKKEYYYYKNIYSQKDFQNLSKIFLLYENLREIISFLKTSKFEVIEKQEFLLLKFNVYLPTGQNKLIELNLPKYISDSKNIINDLIEENQILKEEISNNKNEISKLREDILNNTNEIILLKEENKKLWEVLNQIKDLKINNNETQTTNKILFESKILSSLNDIDFILNYIHEKDKNFYFSNLKLLYRSSRDGDKNDKCHELCDNKQNILIIIKSDSGYIFGGYTKIGYKTVNSSEYKIDNNCFIFSINLKKIYPVKENKKAICHLTKDKGKGLCFNATITIYDNFMHNNNSWVCKGDYNLYFKDLSNHFEINGGEPHFKCVEFEVFQLE